MTQNKVLETEKEFVSVDTESDAASADKVTFKKLPRQPRSWLTPLLVGTGLGVAIAFGGMRLISPPPATQNPNPSQPQTPAPSMSVSVLPVQNTRVARSLNVTGTVAARNLIPVLPQTAGLQVKQILVSEGNTVQKGQPMAILDNAVLQAQIDQARAELESTQAGVGQRQAALAQARATLAEAERTLQRNQQLASNGAISRQDLDTRVTEAATAKEGVRVAQANLNSAQADVRSNLAQIQQLQTQLGQTVVRAPASGLVAEAIAKVGDVANGSQRLFSIIENNALELQAKVPAVQLPQVRVNAPAQITSDADSRVRLQGQVREIAPLVDDQSRQATVKIDIPQTSLLRSGMFARAAINSATVTGITVPSKAVVPQPDGSAIVFVLEGADTVRSQSVGVAQSRSVELGEVLTGGNVEIKNGLKAGERVVVAGAGYLKDGDRVRVVQGIGAGG